MPNTVKNLITTPGQDALHVFLVGITMVFATSAATAREPTLTAGGENADYASVAQAVANAPEHGTVEVKAGTYVENIVINKPLTLKGIGNPVIDGDRKGAVMSLKHDEITIRGFVIRNSGLQDAETDRGVGVYVKSNHNRVVNNRLVRNYYGIYMTEAAHNVIEQNRIKGLKNKQPSARGNGIHLWNSHDNLIRRNTVRHSRDGIYIYTSDRNRFIGNTLEKQRYGIHYMYSQQNLLGKNTFRQNEVGAALMLSQENQVRGNRAVRNERYGILFKDFDNNTVVRNFVLGNTTGLFVYNSESNTNRGNYISNNEVGIEITAGSSANTFFRNTLKSNARQVKQTAGYEDNEWDNGRTGNYWSDYTGHDLDGDGIGEKPHRSRRLVEELTRRYPLVKMLYHSPLLQALQKAEKAFPVLRPESVVDTHPLMRPPVTRKKLRKF